MLSLSAKSSFTLTWLWRTLQSERWGVAACCHLPWELGSVRARYSLCFCDWEELWSLRHRELWDSGWECCPNLSHLLSKLYCLDTTTTSTASKGPGLSVRNIYPDLSGSSLRLCHLPHHGQEGWSLTSGKDRSALAVPLCLSPFGLHMSVQSQTLLYLNLLVVYSAPKERLLEKDLLTIIKWLLILHWQY